MCWEACILCEQCENFKNGCSGQVGTFYKELCPFFTEDPEVLPWATLKKR
ncbi:hypothetical protein Tfer_0040 [Thermincola ferriacetica]|uniref:Uncharacterized protein n=2 Tax=Thermincola TaxID=278993 RepID=D5XE81_THEPJ|nr:MULTISPECIES: hypothetical protein [Thermincola]ADG81952.1 hypothetical protein TherJR_1088 [Thermincola potens JR]KNZ70971.1 hypothetical protein Tfer_0040 [Thermincola ferriacetica]